MVVAVALELRRSDSSRHQGTMQMLLVSAGALAIGIAVRRRPTSTVLLLATVSCIVARMGIPNEWDSIRLVAGFGGIVAAFGTGLAALPIKFISFLGAGGFSPY